LTQYGINVNAVAVGSIDYRDGTSSEIYEYTVKNIPAKRMGKAEKTAKLVAFLASNGSNFINGQCLTIDGGYTAE
jgi:NAD(P)-dependent dehydrogenase (short-subunit alcohol dehydrogenase family)